MANDNLPNVPEGNELDPINVDVDVDVDVDIDVDVDVDVDVDIDVDIDVDVDAIVVIDVDVDIDVDIDNDVEVDVDVDVDVDIDADIDAQPGMMQNITQQLNNWVTNNPWKSAMIGFITGNVGSYYISKLLDVMSGEGDSSANSVDPTQTQGQVAILNMMASDSIPYATKWEILANVVQTTQMDALGQQALLMSLVMMPNTEMDTAMANWRWPQGDEDALVAQIKAMTPDANKYTFMSTYTYSGSNLPIKVGAIVIKLALS